VALDSIPKGFVQVKIAALAPFPFAGMEYGGAERIQNLLTRVNHSIDVFLPNYGDATYSEFANLRMHFSHVPVSLRHQEYDLTIAKHSKQLFGRILQDFEPDLVIMEHPWQAHALSGQKYIYDAHNDETAMKIALRKDFMLDVTQEVETMALRANHVTYCSEDDDLVTESPVTHIPNGTHIPEITRHHGFSSNVLLFVGSAHPPNQAAALTLATLAKALPQYHIVIAGNCANTLRPESDNVTLLGHVDAKMLDYLFRTAHAFMNPIAAGSGTSLTVGRALSYALPVISSALGARGYRDACIITETAQEAFDALGHLRNPKNYAEAADKSRTASYEYSWNSIGAKFDEIVQKVLYDRG
jgi:glycosyltransferase involved in cell wall biosynthesis